MFRILFLGTGDSGRSQMAGAFASQFIPKNMEIVSASNRHRKLHPVAVEVMKEIGLEIPSYANIALEDVTEDLFDVVVTIGTQANEICPLFPGAPAKIYWRLPNPGKDEYPENPREKFRAVRDDIQKRVIGLFEHGFLEALMQVRLTFSSLLDNLTEGVLAHDLKRRIYYFNRAAQRITGYKYTEVIGRDCHQVFPDRFCGGDCSFCVEGVQVHSHFRYPQTFIHKDGHKRDLEMSVVTISNPGDEVNGALVIFRDMTEILHIRRKLAESRGFQGIVGHHISMQKIFDSIQELANVNVPILIQGESGTGKELVAMALHHLSPWSSGPFVAVNCGALPEGILESELFGHVKGAFTGAIRDKKGRFELANGGTIFLDEIGEISANMQVKLLRALQDKAFIPVGGEKLIRIDVRVICATNRDLRQLVQQGLFREDLYYRIAVVPINIPPLRQRVSDIPLLVEHFLEKFSADTGKRVVEVASEAMEAMKRYPWSGNVRELSNAIQFGLIKCRSSRLELSDLPPEIVNGQKSDHHRPPGRPPKLGSEAVNEALLRASGNKSRSAKLLGVSRTSLYRFLKNK